jgi:hypothetical protein
LINICPTVEEIESIKNYSGDGSLGKAESFYLTISSIPRLKERFEIHEICFRWPKDADRIAAQIKTFSTACAEFNSSEVLLY